MKQHYLFNSSLHITSETLSSSKALRSLVVALVFVWCSNYTAKAQLIGGSLTNNQRLIQTNSLSSVVQGIQYDSSFVAQQLRKNDQKLSIFGYYRLFAYGRNITEAYPDLNPYERGYAIGDGYREPMFAMTVVGRPNSKTSFGTEIFMFTPYDGEFAANNVLSTTLGINLYGNFRTKDGNFGVRAGGIHWYNQSPFTIGIFQILDRFSIFDRTPWEGVNNSKKYDSYYQSGAVNPGDLRWNFQAFQGLIVNGAQLPHNFAFDLFWGRTQPNGGLGGALIDPYQTIPPTLDAGEVPNYAGIGGTSPVLPSSISGGKLAKSFGPDNQIFAYNLMHSSTALDSIKKSIRSFSVHTLSLDLNFGKVKLTGELGGGNYSSPTYEKKWGEALTLRLMIPKEVLFIPLDLQVYQINKNFFNPNSEISTNSNPDIERELGLFAGATGYGGQITLVNQLVHNRRGLNLNTGVELGNLKFNIGWGISAEIDPTSTVVTYVHRVNGLALSRIYNPFPANASAPTVFDPYGRKFSFFRGVAESVLTTDINPATAEAINRKYFSAVDLQAKFKTSLNGKDLFFFYLGSFGTADASLTAIPTMRESSYLFVQYHEFDFYYEILPKFIITGYYGIENARGGTFTDWDAVSLSPRDQLGTGIGAGFDWMWAENSGLYFRHRWMKFEDRSFSLDKFQGREFTIEIKTFF
ncbi:MAG: hypothetical protein WED33_09780 [Bacteroidia bacterium]